MDHINAPLDSAELILDTLFGMLFPSLLVPALSTRGLKFNLCAVDKYPVKDRKYLNTLFPMAGFYFWSFSRKRFLPGNKLAPKPIINLI